MKTYTFLVEGVNYKGYPVETYQGFTHESEEQARRELIHYCTDVLRIRPRKLTLVQQKCFQKSPFDFS